MASLGHNVKSGSVNAPETPLMSTIKIREIVINRGSGFIVAVAGDMMRMPGLPKVPGATHIDVIDDKIVGLS